MDKKALTAAVDALVGLEASVATLVRIGEQLRAGGSNDRLRTFGGYLHRNARGIQVAAQAIRQEAHHSSS